MARMTMAGISASRPKSGKYHNQEPMAPEVRKRIEAHLAERLSTPLFLPMLAAVAGMHVPDFVDTFRVEFGVSPKQYLTARRLERVQALLIDTKLPITSIARATGFDSHAQLNWAFKRHFGMAPSAFRCRHPD